MSDWKPQGCDYEGCLRVAVETVGVRYVCERHANFRINEPDKPPLVLPTEPTWGIAVWTDEALSHPQLRQWHQDGHLLKSDRGAMVNVDYVLDFIPLTDEQVARIEATR